MRKMNHAYKSREDDNEANDFIAFVPPSSSKVISNVTSSILSNLGEGESIIENNDTVIRYTKINGKLFKENTTLEEV